MSGVRWYVRYAERRSGEAHAYVWTGRGQAWTRMCNSAHTVSEGLLRAFMPPGDVEFCGDCANAERGHTGTDGGEEVEALREERDTLRAEVEALRVRLMAREANFATARDCLKGVAGERDYWKAAALRRKGDE